MTQDAYSTMRQATSQEITSFATKGEPPKENHEREQLFLVLVKS